MHTFLHFFRVYSFQTSLARLRIGSPWFTTRQIAIIRFPVSPRRIFRVLHYLVCLKRSERRMLNGTSIRRSTRREEISFVLEVVRFCLHRVALSAGIALR